MLKFLTFAILISAVTSASVDNCECTQFHTQEKLCNATFVGIVRVTSYYTKVTIESPDEGFKVISKAQIFKMMKGKYEEFREGSTILLLTPIGSCGVEAMKGVLFISGWVHDYGQIIVDGCSIREKILSLGASQLNTIEHNIRSRAYIKGCEECKIINENDLSYLQDEECRAYYRFPISTSACVKNEKSGKCEWIRRAFFHRLSSSYFRPKPRLPYNQETEQDVAYFPTSEGYKRDHSATPLPSLAPEEKRPDILPNPTVMSQPVNQTEATSDEVDEDVEVLIHNADDHLIEIKVKKPEAN